jgi:hypothetical protein
MKLIECSGEGTIHIQVERLLHAKRRWGIGNISPDKNVRIKAGCYNHYMFLMLYENIRAQVCVYYPEMPIYHRDYISIDDEAGKQHRIKSILRDQIKGILKIWFPGLDISLNLVKITENYCDKGGLIILKPSQNNIYVESRFLSNIIK